MRKLHNLVLIGLLVPSGALATMPVLPDSPKTKTPTACRKWAQKAIKSDEEVSVMWGLQENGQSLPKIALKRLIDDCLGKEMPEIVGFYSSAGVAESYCESHRKTKLCTDYAKDKKK